jgi:hypothetical protein
MIELGVLVLIGAGIPTALLVAACVLKAVFWALLLPIRLVFWTVGGLLLIPFLLLKFIFGTLFFVVALPFLLVAAVISAVAFAIPLLPILLLIALLWYLFSAESQALVSRHT